MQPQTREAQQPRGPLPRREQLQPALLRQEAPQRGRQGQQGRAGSTTSAKASASPFAEPLPSFRDVPAQEKQALFIRKLNLCCYTFDFTDPMKNVKEKEVKRQALLELVDYVNSGTGKFNESTFEDITRMLVANLFRTLPPSGHESSATETFDPEEEEPTMEPAWPHLQIV